MFVTIGEALTQRADLKKKIVDLRARVASNATYTLERGGQDDRAEKGEELLQELDKAQFDLLELIQVINRTNAAAKLTWGDREITLDDAITLRAYFSAMSTQYRELVPRLRVSRPSEKIRRAAARREVVMYNDVKALTPEQIDDLVTAQLDAELEQHIIMKQADALARADQFAQQYRKIDLLIQQANWSTQLI